MKRGKDLIFIHPKNVFILKTLDIFRISILCKYSRELTGCCQWKDAQIGVAKSLASVASLIAGGQAGAVQMP